MPGPRDARELKRMNRVVAGIRKDKDRVRRKRRLAGAAPPPQRERPKPEVADDEWEAELEQTEDD